MTAVIPKQAHRRRCFPELVEHLRKLREVHGMRIQDIADAAGIGYMTVGYAAAGKSCLRKTRDRLMMVKPAGPQRGQLVLVDSTGTKRIIQGSQELGYHLTDVARMLEIDIATVHWILNADKVTFAVRDRARALSRKLILEGKRGPEYIATERAREKGYMPLLAWDDDTIDDPAALPNLTGYDREAVEALLAGTAAAKSFTKVDLEEAVRRSPDVPSRELASRMHVPYNRVAVLRGPTRPRLWPSIDWEEVERLYVDERRSISDVCAWLARSNGGVGPSPKTLHRGMNRHGIKRRPSGGASTAESVIRRAREAQQNSGNEGGIAS